jgi:hypothetical protein
MHRVEALGLREAELHHAGADDPETGLLEAAIDLPDQVLLDAIGFDNGERSSAMKTSS